MEIERVHGFYAFHGTAESCAKKISDSHKFKAETPRPDHWLGQGVYFFREDEEQALMWAKIKVERNPQFSGEKPRVVEVFLESNESNFLNLDTRGGLINLGVYLNEMKKQGLRIEADANIEEIPARIRCYILSILPDTVWMIQRTFKVERSIFDKSELFVSMELSLLGTQICVRNHNVVKKGSIRLSEMQQTRQVPRTLFMKFKAEMREE